MRARMLLSLPFAVVAAVFFVLTAIAAMITDEISGTRIASDALIP